MKPAMGVVVLAVIAVCIGVFVGREKSRNRGDATAVNTQGSGVESPNFIRVGRLSFATSRSKQDRPYLTYRSETNAPETTVELSLDDKSLCVTANGSAPCLAMSVQLHIPFGGKQASVEATEKDGIITVRVLRILT